MRRIFLYLGVAGCVLLLGTMSVYSQMSRSERRAERIVRECASYDTTLREDCYAHTVPVLYPAVAVGELFEVISDIQAMDPTYTSCHLTAHEIGARVAREDPAHWTDGVHVGPPDSPCDGGYLHGLLAARFSTEVLSPQMIRDLVPVFRHVCEPTDTWHPSALDQYECYHGMGHLYVFATNADMPAVMKLCQETVPAFFREEGPRLCYNGAFMQILTPTGPDGFELQKNLPVAITPQSAKGYCRNFIADSMQYGTCLQRTLLLQWPPAATGKSIAEVCSDEPETEYRYCLVRAFKNLGYDVSGKANSDPVICDAAPTTERSLCYETVSLIILKDSSTLEKKKRALDFCSAIRDRTSAEGCLTSLASHGAYFYGRGSESLRSYCELFNGALRRTCTESAVGTYF